MPELKLRQLKYERDTWHRLLAFMIDENIHLKNRLSEILKHVFDKDLLEEMENFQSRFIKEDELIGLLRNDLAELDKLLMREILEDGNIKNDINRKLKNLRSNIVITEAQFSQLKIEFNDYLSEILKDSNRKKYLSDN